MQPAFAPRLALLVDQALPSHALTLREEKGSWFYTRFTRNGGVWMRQEEGCLDAALAEIVGPDAESATEQALFVLARAMRPAGAVVQVQRFNVWHHGDGHIRIEGPADGIVYRETGTGDFEVDAESGCPEILELDVGRLKEAAALAGASGGVLTRRVEREEAIDVWAVAEGGPRRAALDPDAARRADATRREVLVALLAEHGGNVSAVARAMGKARMQIQRWIRRYGLDRAAFQRPAAGAARLPLGEAA